MTTGKAYSEKDLARLAEQFRKKAGKSRAEAAREMRVSQTSIFNAEETPAHALTKLRARMIKRYSGLNVIGPFFFLK